MTHTVQDFVRLRLVVIDTLTIAPAVRREVQRHGVVFLAIGCGTGGAWRTVGIHRPGEVAHRRVLRVGVEHVGPSPGWLSIAGAAATAI